MFRWCAPVVSLLLTAALGGVAGADDPAGITGNPCAPLSPINAQGFAANTNRIGLVDLHYFNAQGAPVTYYECVGGRPTKLGVRSIVNGTITSLLGATPWSCDRLTRHYAATSTLANGQFTRGITSVRTVSCAHRFRVRAPAAAAPGQRVRVRVVDHWDIGNIHGRLCLTPPSGSRICNLIGFAKADSVVTRRFRVRAPGDWRVDFQVRRYHVRDAIGVGVHPVTVRKPPTLLATGDSTMQGVESSLADDLGDAASVVSDVHPGLTISRANELLPLARRQVKAVRPATTVISLGAAEGFPMKTPAGRAHDCCDEAWIGEYARRVRTAMLIYRRHTKGRVYYLTIAAPREAARVPIVNAVNQAIVRAGTGLAHVRVLRMDLLFSPHGYQETIRYRGQDIDVREPDGVHLNASGTAIEAREVVKAIRSG